MGATRFGRVGTSAVQSRRAKLYLVLARHAGLPLFALAFLLVAAPAVAQYESAMFLPRVSQAESQASRTEPAPLASGDSAASGHRTARFLFGAATALGIHEGGHLVFDGIFGVQPVLKRVDFGGIPFFAITHRSGLPPREEFAISSAGFWMQHLSSEIILARNPRLRDDTAPFFKGLLAFNVLASMAYGTAALAGAGPGERDTRAMAQASRLDEKWIASIVMIPAALDAWRYFHPDAAWAKWLSRGVKVGGVLLVVR